MNRETIAIIVNGHAKGMTDAAARSGFRERAASVIAGVSVHFAERGSELCALADKAIANGAETIVAAGGDGTVSTIASRVIHCADREITLGLIPLGTLNHFARDLGIPNDVDAALTVIANGHAATVDVGEVNGQIFLNNSGLGLYPDMVQRRMARQSRGGTKWISAFVEGARALARYRLLGIRLTVDGQTLLRRTPAVFIGNNEYTSAGTVLPTRSSIDRGTFCLYVPHPKTRIKLVWFAIRALLGHSKTDRAFDMMQANSVTIESRHSQLRVALDGEVSWMKPPLEYRIRPGALHVLVPHRNSVNEASREQPA